jgi:hypothetical protein
MEVSRGASKRSDLPRAVGHWSENQSAATFLLHHQNPVHQ